MGFAQADYFTQKSIVLVNEKRTRAGLPRLMENGPWWRSGQRTMMFANCATRRYALRVWRRNSIGAALDMDERSSVPA